MKGSISQWLAPEAGPATLKTRPWGGTRLAELRDAPPSIARPIGESWEFCTLPGSESRAKGVPLSELLDAPLPFLVKLLDTAAPLSLQLHPADDPAQQRVGKEEAWIVLDAEPGAQVLAGLRPGCTHAQLAALTREAFADPQGGAGDRLVDVLQPIPVQRGSVVFVPARTVHAIQGGILLAEIQQPSDCTFRLWDYGSERDTHADQVLEHIDVGARAPTWQPGQPMTELSGSHLKLRVLLGPGTHRFVVPEGGAPRLLVPVQGEMLARSAGQSCALCSGELRLHHQGELEVELADGAQLVVGELS